MKYWAILKDSFYETIDFKVFYVLLGISSLIIVFCFGLQFPHVSLPEALVKNLETHAGPDMPEFQARRDRDSNNRIQSGDAAAMVGNITAVSGNHDRFQFEFKPKSDQSQRTEGDGGETRSAPAKRNFGQALQLTVIQRQTMNRALHGEIAFDALWKLMTPPRAPTTKEAWTTVVTDYLDSFEGISHARVVQIDGDPAVIPARFLVEATIDEVKLPYRRQFGLFFSLWRFDLQNVGSAVFIIQSVLVNAIAGWVGLIVALVVTAGFVPSMLQKGTLDFLLVKPIHRPTLLLWKYVGGLLFVFFHAAFLVGGTWVAFGVNTGNWSPWYLLSVVILVAFFAILYSLTVLIGVWSRSALAAILITLGFWFVLFLVQVFYNWTIAPDAAKEEWVKNFPPALTATVDWIHYLLPKPEQLAELNQMLLSEANKANELTALQQASRGNAHINWTETISSSAVFIAVMLGLASWRFSRKDY